MKEPARETEASRSLPSFNPVLLVLVLPFPCRCAPRRELVGGRAARALMFQQIRLSHRLLQRRIPTKGHPRHSGNIIVNPFLPADVSDLVGEARPRAIKSYHQNKTTYQNTLCKVLFRQKGMTPIGPLLPVKALHHVRCA